MKQAVLASIALFGTSALAQVGSAVVLNQCPYEVYLHNVPSADGGYTESDTVLQPGGSWSQVWTELTNGNGWSIKLSKSTDLTSILQYEYTFHNDGNLWYDLSAVNGDPWSGDWDITSESEGCTPKLAAYLYPTDDANGMQWCPQAATISAVLCPSGSPATSASSSVWSTSTTTPAWSTSSESPIALPTTVSVPSVSVTPVPVASTTSTTASPFWQHSSKSFTHPGQVQAAVEVVSTPVPTTFATSTTAPVEEAPGVTVWEVETAVVTAVVTAVYTGEAPSRIKRHQHGLHQHGA